MTLTSELVLELITLLTTVISAIWWIANKLSNIRSRLDKLEAACNRLDKFESNLEGVETNCREGRVKLWETVNEERMRMAEMRAKVDK